MAMVIHAIDERKDLEGFSKSIPPDVVSGNDYILSPSRYIDFKASHEQHRDFDLIVRDINHITEQLNACKLTINESLAKNLLPVEEFKELSKTSFKDQNELLKKLGAQPLIECDYFALSRKKNEIKFENKSKNILSEVMLFVLLAWAQNLYHLNNEQSRYLAELRDALLPGLMSGEIDVSDLDIDTSGLDN